MPSTEKEPIALVFAVLLSGPACAEIIPADRRTDWTPGVTVGVPGGIPDRAQAIGATVHAAEYGTGLVDAAGAIGAAIDACPPGKVVFIPAGTYRMDSRVYRASASHITVRGAGMGKTVLKANSGGQILLFGTSDWPRPTAGLAVTDGATKGNKVLTLADASSISVGNLVRIEQDNPPYVSGPTASTKLMTAMFKVAKTDTTITVTPPLPCSFTLSPRLVPYKLPPLSSTGVEDLTIDCNALSGIGIVLSLLLGVDASPLYLSRWWLALTAFVGLNLFQYGFNQLLSARLDPPSVGCTGDDRCALLGSRP